MIGALVGKPGAGKSYEAVRLCLDAVKQGRVVVTNLPLVKDHPEWVAAAEAGLLHLWQEKVSVQTAEGKELERLRFSVLSDWEEAQSEQHLREVGQGQKKRKLGPLIVIDEIGSAFADAPKGEAERIRVLLSKHRHSLADYYLVVQAHNHLPQEIKPLVEAWCELASLKRAGIKGYHWSVYSSWYGAQREASSSGFRRYHKERFQYYDSHALGAGAGADQDESNTLFDSWPVYLRLPFLLCYAALFGILWFAPSVYETVTGAGSPKEAVGFAGASGGTPAADGSGTVEGPVVVLPSVSGSILDFGEVPPALLALGRYRGLAGSLLVFEAGSLTFAELVTLGASVQEASSCDLVLSAVEWRRSYRCR